MASTADGWRSGHEAERGSRLAVAFGVSLVCHLALLVALRGLRMEARSMAPLVVTMVARGGAGEGDAAGPVGSAGPAPAAVAAVTRPMPAVAPVPIAPPAKVQRLARTATPPRRSVPAAPMDPAVAAAAPRVASSTASSVVGAGPQGESATADGSGEAGVALAGAAGRGAGSGGGAGGGADGLRAFCASCPAPEYPGRARRQGWQGTVDVDLAIAVDGSVREAHLGRSSGYPALDDVAVDVARRSRFTVPPGGQELRGQLRYRFVLDATAARR